MSSPAARCVTKVMANLVHRDFENEVAKFGDVVNTRRPGEFKIRRKTDATTLVQQDATATNVPVTLDQWFYQSFVIRDGEGSKSFQELSDIYLKPAMLSISRGIDRALLGRVHAYLGAPATGRVGKLGQLSSTTARDYCLDARELLNVNKAPVDGRRLILAPGSETAMLKTDLFLKANERGDGGTALENAILGRILGFDTYMDQNVNNILTGVDISATAITTTEPHFAGYAGAIESASIAAEASDGEFLVINGTVADPTGGNNQPTWCLTHIDATSFTLNEALKYPIIDNAIVSRYVKAAVAAVELAKGYSKAITLTHTAAKPVQVGQLLAFGTTVSTRHTYTVIESEYVDATHCTVYLDRPLDLLVASGAECYPGPTGAMNLAFHRDALALITRPLALPDSRMGVMSAVVPHNGIGMRVLMQYDINVGGTIVNCDILAGVAVLNSGLCIPVLG